MRQSKGSNRTIACWLIALSVVGVGFAAAPVGAEVFTVTLNGGGTIQSRYRPQEAPWNTEKVLMRTEWGNWISLAKSEIQSVAADTETKGFGLVIDEATVELGAGANDAPVPDELAPGQAPPPMQFQMPAPYSIQQFVEPGQAQGLPSGFLGYGASAIPPMVATPQPPPNQNQ